MRETSPQLVIGHRMLIEYEVNLTVPLANGKYCCLNLGHSFGIMFQQLNIDFEGSTNFDFSPKKMWIVCCNCYKTARISTIIRTIN